MHQCPGLGWCLPRLLAGKLYHAVVLFQFLLTLVSRTQPCLLQHRDVGIGIFPQRGLRDVLKSHPAT